MSKKKNNIKNKVKFNQNTNNFDDKMSDKVKLIKEHHLILWFLFFFPVALYKSFKYKILPKWVNIVITFLFAILFIVIVDTIINPNRVADNKIEIELEDFNEDLGNIISIEQYDIIENYYIYDVISSNGRYDVYIDSSYEIKAIKQIDLYSKNIYIAEDFEEKYKNIYSEIIRFVNKNTISISNNIEEVIKTDTKQQTLKIDGKEYLFNIAFENVDSIYDENKDFLYENGNPSLRLNKDVFKKVSKKFPQTSDINYASTIEFYEDNYVIYFYTTDGTLYQLIIYEDGKISVNVAKETKK